MDNLNNAAQRQLNDFIKRIERLTEEKKALTADINEVFNEAKSTGFDVKAMKRVLRLMGMTKAEREEEDAIVETYARAVGLIGLPLGDFADRQEGALVAL